MPKSAYVPLLKTKITLPPARSQLVERPRLVERLHAGLARPLTLVAAPAGFGKTTLVIDWLHQLKADTSVAWLSLDEDDADAVHFLYYLVATLQAVEPGVGRAPISLLGGLGTPAPKDLVTLLLNEIGESGRRIVLASDDYHLIQNPEIDAAMALLIERMPEEMRVVLVTRDQPDLPHRALADARSRQRDRPRGSALFV